jgi:hypothetical protein
MELAVTVRWRSAMMISLDENRGRFVVLLVLSLALAAWLFIPA